MVKKIIISLILIISLLGCFGGFPEVKKVGIIEGYIKDSITGKTVGNTFVKVSDDFSYVTDSDGYFPLVNRKDEEDPYFIPKENGNSYQITNGNYHNKEGTNIFSYGQKNLIGYITPKVSDKSNYIEIEVSDEDGLLEGANVIINGTFTTADNGIDEIPITGITSVDGKVTKELPNGWLSIYVYKDGYIPKYKEINFIEEQNYSFELSKNEDIKFGDVDGIIRGFKIGTGEGQAENGFGAIVKINGQWCMADSGGKYTLKGIPAGNQVITVKMPGFYQTYTEVIEIKEGYNDNTIESSIINMEPIKGE